MPTPGGSANGPIAGRGATLWQRAWGWLPPETAIRHFLVASVVAASGTGLFLTGSALFFTRSLGLGVDQVGLALSLAGVTGLVSSVPIGRLADRIGPSRTLVGLYVWRAGCFVAFPLVDSFGAFVLVACLAGAAEWATAPAVQAIIGRLSTPESRVRNMAALTLVRNVGFSAGAGMATVAISLGDGDGYVLLIWANAAVFIVAATLVARITVPAESAGTPPGAPSAATARAPWWALRRGALPSGRYLALAGLNGVLYLHAVLLSVALPLWIVSETDAPEWTVGLVMLVNTLLAVALQMRLSRGVEAVRDAARRQWWGGLALAASCVVIAVVAAAPAVVAVTLVLAAVALLTLGEIWQSVGAWGLSFQLSDPRRRTEQLAVYNLGTTIATIAGPVLLTSVVMPAGGVGWVVLAAALAGAGAVVVPIARRGQPVASDPADGAASATVGVVE